MFGSVFDQTTIHRLLLSLKRTGGGQPSTAALSATGLGVSVSPSPSGVAIKVTSEALIRRLLSPEQICSMQAAQYGAAQLTWSGVKFLKSFDRLAVARTILQHRDAMSDIDWAKAVGVWKYVARTTDEPWPQVFKSPPPFRGQAAYSSVISTHTPCPVHTFTL